MVILATYHRKRKRKEETISILTLYKIIFNIYNIMSRINTTSTLRIPTTDNKHQPRIERRKPRKPKWMEHTPVKNKFSRSTEHLKHNVDVLHYRPPRHVGGFEPSGATKTEREVAKEMLKNKSFKKPAETLLNNIIREDNTEPTKLFRGTDLIKLKGEFGEKVKEKDEAGKKKKKNKKNKDAKKKKENDDDDDDDDDDNDDDPI